MATISVRLSEDDKRALDAIRKATGQTASEVLRRALKDKKAAMDRVKADKKKSAADIYREIMAESDDEPAGPPTDDASHVSERVRAILEAKHARRSRPR